MSDVAPKGEIRATDEPHTQPVLESLRRQNEQAVAEIIKFGVDHDMTPETMSKMISARYNHLELLAKDVKRLAMTDTLTGALNRRGMEDELSKIDKNGTEYTLFMLDLDHFKNFNDTYGHQNGDVALSNLVASASTVLREDVDIIAKYGGEEFVIVLPGITDLKLAEEVAERVRAQISQTPVIINMADGKMEAKTITASIGVSSKNNNYIDTIKKADRAMYQAKEAGRNQVVVAKK